MKKIIEPAKPEKAEYICDLCKKPIESDDFGTDIVKILVDSVVGNGWKDWLQREEYHSHKKGGIIHEGKTHFIPTSKETRAPIR